MNQMLKLSVKHVKVTIIHNTSIMNDKFSEKKERELKKIVIVTLKNIIETRKKSLLVASVLEQS